MKNIIAIAVLAAFISGGCANNTINTQGQTFGSWLKTCEAAAPCYLKQQLSNGMNVVLGYGKNKKYPTMIIELPGNVDSKQGVQLKVGDNKPVGFSSRCNGKGCRGGFTLDKQLTQQFKQGKTAKVAYKKQGNDEPVIHPINLSGTAEGLQALLK